MERIARGSFSVSSWGHASITFGYLGIRPGRSAGQGMRGSLADRRTVYIVH